MQSLPVTFPTIVMTFGACERVNAFQVSPESRGVPLASGETVPWKNVECQRGDYLSTLGWLKERQACLRREGYRVRRTSFQARGSRWVSRIIYTREQEPVTLAFTGRRLDGAFARD